MPATARYPSLEDLPVLITGGATGIGATLVEHFVAQGARVGFIDLDEAAGHALVQRLAGGTAHAPVFVAADLTDIPALQAAIAHIRAAIGPIRALFNNAANDRRQAIATLSATDWDAGVAVNLRHQFFAAQAVIPDMRAAGGGSIVNFGSMSWKAKQGGMPVYTSCKAAVQGLTRGMARDLGPDGIRVNTLVPGWVMTEKQLQHRIDAAARVEIDRNQCIPRPLMPEDIAAMALFLAAEDSAMCTGQDFVVDAGWT